MDKIVEDYLKEVEKELSEIDSNLKKSILKELRTHIFEESKDLALKKGIVKPDEGIYLKVFENIGNPVDVANQ